MKIELAQVSVKRWEADQWAPVVSCGVSDLEDDAAESVTDDELSLSDQVQRLVSSRPRRVCMRSRDGPRICEFRRTHSIG